MFLRSRQHTARLGENLAANYLKKQGYKVLVQNYRIRGGEIDIIARHKDTLVFVEVKTRYSRSFGLPEEAITPKKLSFLQRAAQFYCTARNVNNIQLRVDVVVIELMSTMLVKRIELITNVTG